MDNADSLNSLITTVFSTVGLNFVIFLTVIRQNILIGSYIQYRKNKTNKKTMKYVRSILNSIIEESIRNAKALGLEPENLNSYIVSVQAAMYMGLYSLCEEFIEENGYYDLIKKNGRNDPKVKTLIRERGEQLRKTATPYIDSILPPNSVLRGKEEDRFSTEKAVYLFGLIVDRHVWEIEKEVETVNLFIKKNVPCKIYKLLPKYKHVSEHIF